MGQDATSSVTVIPPSVGRIVWFYPAGSNPNNSPHAAIVTRVWNDRMVNLACFNQEGVSYGKTSVTLVQQGDAHPIGDHCEWMPYQLGQAQKTEAAEKIAAGTGTVLGKASA